MYRFIELDTSSTRARHWARHVYRARSTIHIGTCFSIYFVLFHFNQKVRFEFSATSSTSELMAQHFPKFLKVGQPCGVYPNLRKLFPGSVLSIQLFSCSQDFLNFRLINDSHFGNSTASRISGNISGKFLYYLPLFPDFRKFWLNGKCLLSPVSHGIWRQRWTQRVNNTWFLLLCTFYFVLIGWAALGSIERTSGTVMGNRFVLFDVSMEISPRPP